MSSNSKRRKPDSRLYRRVYKISDTAYQPTMRALNFTTKEISDYGNILLELFSPFK